MLRRPTRTLLVVLTTAGLAVAGIGVAVAGSRGDSVTVTRAGTVIDGQKINGYLHIKANNVTIRNATLRYAGNHTLRVFSGFTGTVIEDTKIYCEATKTNGVVFGNYTARRVDLFGCKNGFMYSDSAPAVIVDSTWNGRPVSVGSEPGGRPAPAPSPTRSTTPTPSPTPSATTSTAPAPKPTRTTASAPPPPASGGGIPASFPGPHNTGVPGGVTLRNSGGITADKDGQVISGLNINGCVTVTAKNVVIRNSRITCGGTYSIRTNGAKNLVVEDVEINGMGKNSAAVCCGDYTLRRVEITNVIDGPRLGSNTRVEDSWIHHLTRVSGSHNDVLQTTGASNIVVRGNSLEAYNPNTRDPFNACLMIGSTTGPIVSNLVFEQNYCNGGNYSIGVREDLNAANIVIRNNVYGRDFRYGVIARTQQAGITWDSASNVFADNRRPVK
ncbi:hypothetical protein [Polymorphospora rubra]|uniref:Right handed beta helix domain-containing protein n=1 Tax=Polymorphospora rubra TaxID=338584 RepID=A0A810MZJ5_9ACTN|nr:hypothetical protein [Polymorphospora rubra]BCJ66552.1 hypothetical protein Prubr_35730 [Polymorphospora rubra]